MRKIFIIVCTLASLVSIPALADDKNVKPENGVAKVEATESKELSPSMKWELMSAENEPTAAQLTDYSGSGLNEKKVAYYHDRFKETYIVKETVVPGDPTKRIVIRKPEIYNAVRNAEKALNRAVKKKEMSREDSDRKLCHILEVSLAAVDSDTATLENALGKNRNNPEMLLAIFDNVSLKNIYK